MREEIRDAGLEREIWQAFAVLPDIRSVGVMGDERTYGHPIIIRAVTSEDAMTADWARLPYDLLERMSSRIINEVRGRQPGGLRHHVEAAGHHRVGVTRGIDEAPVSAWLSAHVPGVEPPFSFALIAGGRSNLTYEVTDAAGRHVVLRRPPLGHVLATAHDMAREHRIISALVGTAVPVPTTLALCTDTEVNGSPFYVMSFVDGVVLDSAEKGAALSLAARRDVAFDLVDVLAELHLVDVDAVGLGDLAKRTGYVERQLKRWSAQWRDSRTRELPAIEEVEAGLRARIPDQQAVTIAHGDYRFGNCLVDPAVGRLAGGARLGAVHAR